MSKTEKLIFYVSERVRHIQERLEEFIKSLNSDREWKKIRKNVLKKISSYYFAWLFFSPPSPLNSIPNDKLKLYYLFDLK